VPMLLLDSCSLIELKSFIQRQVLGKRLPDHKVASSMLLIFCFWRQGRSAVQITRSILAVRPMRICAPQNFPHDLDQNKEIQIEIEMANRAS
jgi:hypothetical protein